MTLPRNNAVNASFCITQQDVSFSEAKFGQNDRSDDRELVRRGSIGKLIFSLARKEGHRVGFGVDFESKRRRELTSPIQNPLADSHARQTDF